MNIPYIKNVLNLQSNLPGRIDTAALQEENRIYLAYLAEKTQALNAYERIYAQTDQEKQAALLYERKLKHGERR